MGFPGYTVRAINLPAGSGGFHFLLVPAQIRVEEPDQRKLSNRQYRKARYIAEYSHCIVAALRPLWVFSDLVEKPSALPLSATSRLSVHCIHFDLNDGQAKCRPSLHSATVVGNFLSRVSRCVWMGCLPFQNALAKIRFLRLR